MLKSVLSIVKSAIKITHGVLSEKDGLAAQYDTVTSVKQLGENMFILDYKNDYYIDEMLRDGCSDINEMVDFVAKKTLLKKTDFPGADYIGGGCSTFEAYTPEGNHIMGRNFDFKDAPCMVVWTHPKNHYASVAVADTNFMAYGTHTHKIKGKKNALALLAPYCCVDGINEKGLAIAVLQIRADAVNQNDSSKKNLTTTAMIRAALDTCADIDEAVELFRKYNMHDLLGCCYHYQLIDKSGKSVIIEYINNEMFVYSEIDKKYPCTGSVFCDDNIPFLYSTNCTATKDIGDFKVEQHGKDRMDAMVEVLKAKNGVLTENEAMDLLSYVKLDYNHPKYPWNIVALWSSVYNADKCTMKIVANTDYKNVYTFDVNKPCEIISKDDVSSSAYTTKEWEYL